MPDPPALYPLPDRRSQNSAIYAPSARPTNGALRAPPPASRQPPAPVSDGLFPGFTAADAWQGPLPDDLAKGKSIATARSLMQPQELAIRLLPKGIALQILRFARKGCPVNCGEPWSPEVIQRAREQGPHVTALIPENVELLWDDVTYQNGAEFVRIERASILFRAPLPPELKISRVAVVPQTGRRGRIIVNLSAKVDMAPTAEKKRRARPHHGSEPPAKRHRPSVNETTEPAEDQGAVKALGTAMLAILMFMFDVDPEWVIDWQKIDLSDGFWRMIVEKGKEYNFVYQLPRRPGDTEDHFVIPSSLQMGWKNSPAYFCTATEAGRELMRRILALSVETGLDLPHRYEKYCVPGGIPDHMPAWVAPEWFLVLARVFVDDYINAVAGPPGRSERVAQILWLARAALHAIHSIFPPPEVLQHKGGRDSVSEAKAQKGDTMFAPQKILLGVDCCGEPRENRAVNIPDSKLIKYTTQVEESLCKPYISYDRFNKLHGRVQYCSSIIPHFRGFMSPMNRQLNTSKALDKRHTVSLAQDSDVREALSALVPHMHMARLIPVHITEIVAPDLPHIHGGVDAAAVGMGGYACPCTMFFVPITWRVDFPDDIRRHVESQGNVITNSDVEAIAGFVYECMVEDLVGRTEGISSFLWSDNTPTVSWLQKYASKASSRIPELMLRLLALRHRWDRRGPHDIQHWKGKNNLMADFASRSFEQGYPASPAGDHAYLTEFQRRFPLPPQLGSWRLVQPRTEIISAAFSILRNKIDWSIQPGTEIGNSGLGLPVTVAKTRTSCAFKAPATQWNAATCSWPLLDPSGKVDTAAMVQAYQGRRSRQRFVKSRSTWSIESLRTLGDNMRRSPSSTPT